MLEVRFENSILQSSGFVNWAQTYAVCRDKPPFNSRSGFGNMRNAAANRGLKQEPGH